MKFISPRDQIPPVPSIYIILKPNILIWTSIRNNMRFKDIKLLNVEKNQDRVIESDYQNTSKQSLFQKSSKNPHAGFWTKYQNSRTSLVCLLPVLFFS